MRRVRLLIWVCSALVVGCATSAPRHTTHDGCGAVPGARLWARTELYFGMGKPDSSFTSNEEYQHFVDKEVTPRFKDGFTVLEGRGQYLDPTGRLWHEPTKVLVLMYPPDPAQSTGIDAIRNAYKTEFQQESVLRVDGTVCVAF
jgi:Protein of unknown function (DUF3574)